MKKNFLAGLVFFLIAYPIYPLAVTDSANAPLLAETLFNPGTGLSITSASLTSSPGYYPAAFFTDGPMGIADGIIIANGNASDALPPNTSTETGVHMGVDGDDALISLITGEPVLAYDTIVLEIHFDVDAATNSLSFDFIFGSEEYPEYRGSQYNDSFGVFLNGDQIVFDDTGAPITINGPYFDPAGGKVQVPPDNGLEYDGSTMVLNTQAPLVAGSVNNILKIVISDVADGVLDSGVLLAGLKGDPEIVGTPGTRPHTQTPTATPSPSETPFISATITMTHSITETHTITKTKTVTPTVSNTPTITVTNTHTPTLTVTPTVTQTMVPFVMDLEGSFPNPFVDETRIVYWLSREAEVEVKIFTVSGEVVREYQGIHGHRGHNSFLWNGRNRAENNVASGVYIYRITGRTRYDEVYSFIDKMTCVR